jgi:hypothetical protein
MTAASRSLATALSRARFASGLIRLSYTTTGDRTRPAAGCGLTYGRLNHRHQLAATAMRRPQRSWEGGSDARMRSSFLGSLCQLRGTTHCH